MLRFKAFVGTALAIAVSNIQPAAAAPTKETQIAVFAGGCFWGMESVFEHIRGVTEVRSGYAGGAAVGFGRSTSARSGFAEAVQVRFDPTKVTYRQLLVIFFRVAHDPTQVDRQGPDIGERYRSAIFPRDREQRQLAERSLADLRNSRTFSKPVATNIESGAFQAADSSQQDYVRRHPSSRYVIVNDLPKLAALKQRYPELWSD